MHPKSVLRHPSEGVSIPRVAPAFTIPRRKFEDALSFGRSLDYLSARDFGFLDPIACAAPGLIFVTLDSADDNVLVKILAFSYSEV
jgi:hypothetical protein